jgi:apolipoprotein N-acyltransferase
MTYLILFTSGLLTALPFIFPKLWFVAWFAASPLFFIAARKKSAYRHGITFFAGFYGLLYYWFTCLYPMDFAGFDNLQSVLLIAVCWIGLTALQGLVFAIVPVLYRKLRTGNVYADPFLAASLWVIFEWLQTQTWMGVPWGRLAVSQYAMLPAIQSASLLGSLFISFLIILSNGFIASTAIKLAEGNFKNKDKRPLICVAISFTIFGANLLYGKTALFIYNDDDAVTVTAAVIQGNIASGDKWADDSVKNSLLIYTELTTQAATKYSPQLILWPETVITTSLREESYVRDNISELAKATGAVILVGAYDYVDDAKTGDYDRYNAIYAFYPNGSVSEQPYYKRHIVPFGEYLPSPWFFKTFIPVLANMNVFKYDLTPGTETNLIDSDYGKLGGLVCFDSIYEELARQSVNDGANLIVLSTNDSWYRDSAAVYQHNGHAVLRAVENGRYVVRAANTGVSTVISPTGEILTMLAPLTEGYTAANVKMLENRTVYSYIGDTWIIACAVFAASLGIAKIVLRKRGNGEARGGSENP